MSTHPDAPKPAADEVEEVETPRASPLRGFTRKWLPWLAVAAVLVLALYRVKVHPTPVTLHTVATGEILVEVMGTGTLEARIKTTLSARIQERLAEVRVDQGDAVAPGQLLARLDDGETRQQVAIAEATLLAARATVERVRADEARAQAVLQQAQQDHQRFTELLAGRIAAQADFDKAAETLKIAEADLNRSRSAIAEALSQVFTAEKTLLYHKEHLSFTDILSPYGGLVIRRDRDPGGIVVPGSSILQLIDTNEIWVSAWIDETAISSLREHQPARVVFRSESSRSYPGEVARIGREADRETREFVVDVRVQPLPERWTIGQRAEVFIETDRKTDALIVPLGYVHWRDGQPGVWVHDRGKARWREITLGIHGRNHFEVVQGLSAGEQIAQPILGPKQRLTDGQHIRTP
jgi:HlyD family secretion protein